MEYPKNIRGTFAIQTALRGTSVQPDWNVTDQSSEAYIKNKPIIPTKDIVSRWGFGTYSKPSDGIPATDLKGDVVQALNKANSAVQPSDLQTAIEEAITTTLNTPV